MAVTDRPSSTGTAAIASPTDHDGDRPGRTPRARGTLRRGLPFALELLTLTAFVFARPVFGSFGRSPETFVARGADWTDVIVFGLVVLLAPGLSLIVLEVVVGLIAGERVRWLGHLAVVAGLLALAVWQIADPAVGWDREVGLTASLAGGLALTVLWARFVSVATFFRYASLGAVVFLVQFLALSPVSSIVFGGRHAAADMGAVDLDADAPPVVLVIFDGLPTEILLDGTGHVDAELYPNLASLAGDATWYRNHTSVAQFTLQAVPAILSGSQPGPDQTSPVASGHPRNLFTLLGGTHEVHGGEAITGLCPVAVCPEPAGSPLGGLLGDAGSIWRRQMSQTAVDPELIPYVFEGRYGRSEDWIAAQDFDRAGKPGLHVVHLLVPHPLWEYLPDGSRYQAMSPQPAGLFIDTWSEWAIDVGRQRHVLQTQAADRLLGELVDRLRADDAYDDALVAVTADHGYAFAEGAPWRALDQDNYDQIMWTPLIVKAPGQREPVIDDSNVNTLDIVPTIAAELGIDDLPWEADGRPAGSVERDPEDKWIVDWRFGRLHPDDDGDLVHVDGVEGFERMLDSDPVEGTGPRAVWSRTEYGGLVGRKVDELDVGDATGEVLTVNDLDRWDDVDTDNPPLEVVALGVVPAEAPVAVTVDGVVAAVVPPSRTSYGISIVHALLWPDALGDGRNEIGAYAVDGEATAPVLHELEVEARSDD